MTSTTTPEKADTPGNAPVLVTRAGAVVTVMFNRPDSMNSLDAATRRALLDALTDVGGDPAVRAVVLTGSGRAFCVGHDLKEHLSQLAPGTGDESASLDSASLDEVWSVVPRDYNPLVTAIAAMDKPVIAAVNGVAAGAGASLAFLADLRILSSAAGFNLAFAGIGLSCDTGSSWTLPRLVGPARATELLFNPRTIDAVESRELGLASEVVAAADFAEHVAGVAQRMASGPTLAYGAMRQSIAFGASHSLAETLEFEATQMARTGASADHLAAVKSFVSKEKPNFDGR